MRGKTFGLLEPRHRLYTDYVHSVSDCHNPLLVVSLETNSIRLPFSIEWSIPCELEISIHRIHQQNYITCGCINFQQLLLEWLRRGSSTYNPVTFWSLNRKLTDSPSGLSSRNKNPSFSLPTNSSLFNLISIIAINNCNNRKNTSSFIFIIHLQLCLCVPSKRWDRRGGQCIYLLPSLFSSWSLVVQFRDSSRESIRFLEWTYKIYNSKRTRREERSKK